MNEPDNRLEEFREWAEKNRPAGPNIWWLVRNIALVMLGYVILRHILVGLS